MTEQQQDVSELGIDESVLVDLDPEDLEREIVEFTADLSLAGAQLSEAQRQVAYAKLAVEEVEAYNRIALKSQHEIAGQRSTEKSLDAAVAALQPVMAARRVKIEATAQRDRLRAKVRALEAKERMLDLLGRRMIAEMRMDPAAALAGASKAAWSDTPRLG